MGQIMYVTLKPIFFAIISFGLMGCGKKIEKRAREAKVGFHNDKSNENPHHHSQSTSSKQDIQKKDILLSAISSNSPKMVESALKESTHIDYHFSNGETPLTFALKLAKEEVISMIINKSQKINLPNKGGQPPLHLAIRFNKYLAFTKLIHKGAKLDMKDSKRKLALSYSLTAGKERYFIYLLINGAHFNLKLDDKGPSLRKRLEDLKFSKSLSLMESINAHQVIHESFLIDSVQNCNINFINYLLMNFSFYREFIQENNILYHTITTEDLSDANKLTDLLLKWGANPNLTEPVPPLITAIKLTRNYIVGALASFGGDLSLVDSEGLNLLDHTVKMLNLTVIEEIFVPIKNSLKRTSHKEKNKSIEMFANACQYLPEDGPDEMDKKEFSQRKRSIYRFLDCQDS